MIRIILLLFLLIEISQGATTKPPKPSVLISCGTNCTTKTCNSATEVYMVCGPSCQKTCDCPVVPKFCTSHCVRSCHCKPGYVRDIKNCCIKIENCPKKCNDNEEYKECGPKSEDICNIKGDPAGCTPGCFCKNEYVRDQLNGTCIPQDDCPIICDASNEEPNTCGPMVDCERTCDIPDPDPTICNDGANCTKGCFCTKGMIRDVSGVCIDDRDCPIECNENEEFILNRTQSCDRTCKNLTTDENECSVEHDKGCFCIDGFVRDENNVCIEIKDCPTDCPNENETYLSDGPIEECESTCDNPEIDIDECSDTRKPGCFCIEGTVRDENGNCIEIDKCPIDCSNENETYLSDGPIEDCESTCDNPDIDIDECSSKRKPGCFCVEGTVRNENGKCIKIDECPTSCPENEILSQSAPTPDCQPKCHDEVNENCPINKRYLPNCICKEGLIRNSNGICIPEDQCTAVSCNANEEFKTCGTYCQPSCDDRNPVATVGRETCVAGCFCKEDYIRNEFGACIPIDTCPENTKCENGTQFMKCGPSLEQNCDHFKNPFPAPDICVAGCFCPLDEVKNDDGMCVKAKEFCCPENEEYIKCGPDCDRECATLGDVCTIVHIVCNSQCFCKDGFARNDEGTCIPIKKCPKRKCKKDNEEYKKCGPSCPATCNTVNVKCTSINGCVAGCFCSDGYVRDKKGNCIPKEKCIPKCVNNETYMECGPSCAQTCENLDNMCILKCNKPGCYCPSGYVRNKQNICVNAADYCKPSCNKNEIYAKCGKDCTGDDNPCEIEDECQLRPGCKLGCYCKDNYIRNIMGVCVKKAGAGNGSDENVDTLEENSS